MTRSWPFESVQLKPLFAWSYLACVGVSKNGKRTIQTMSASCGISTKMFFHGGDIAGIVARQASESVPCGRVFVRLPHRRPSSSACEARGRANAKGTRVGRRSSPRLVQGSEPRSGKQRHRARAAAGPTEGRPCRVGTNDRERDNARRWSRIGQRRQRREIGPTKEDRAREVRQAGALITVYMSGSREGRAAARHMLRYQMTA